jgi:hypothetical protein
MILRSDDSLFSYVITVWCIGPAGVILDIYPRTNEFIFHVRNTRLADSLPLIVIVSMIFLGF